ncbi:hypothetical protein LguiB_028829 [Lonicera macranthoides]
MLGSQALSRYDFTVHTTLSISFPKEKEIDLRACCPTLVCDEVLLPLLKTCIGNHKIISRREIKDRFSLGIYHPNAITSMHPL